jgi:hypothetical protein
VRPARVVEISGTLSDVSRVVHFISGPEKDWEGFFGNMNSVPVNSMVRDFIKKFRQSHAIVLVSGAPDRYQAQTIDWLQRHRVPYDGIYFRPAYDKRKGWQFKKSLYEKRLKNLYQVKLVLDDKQDACEQWIKMGLQCWKLPSDIDTANQMSNEPGKRFAHLVKSPRIRN